MTIYGFFRRAALALAVATLVPAPAHAQSPDDDDAVRICERKEWKTKGCQALRGSMDSLAQMKSEAATAKARADASEVRAAKAEERREFRSRVRAMNDQLYSYLVDRGAMRPDPEKAKVPYDAGKAARTAADIAAEAAKFPPDDGTRKLSGLLLTIYRQKIDPEFAPSIP